MGYWKSKVVPKLRQVFDSKKIAAAAAEECKSFDESKVEISKQIEEKREELLVKVSEIYNGCSSEIKAIVKEPTEASLKKHSSAVKKFLADLSKTDFPGSKQAREAAAKYGLSRTSTCALFVVEKVSTFVPSEPVAPTVEDVPVPVPPPTEMTPDVIVKEKEIIEKTEEVAVEKIEEVVVEKEEKNVLKTEPEVKVVEVSAVVVKEETVEEKQTPKP